MYKGQVWVDVQEMGVDLVCQPLIGRRKTMLLADMDSTLIQPERLDELADDAGTRAPIADIPARAKNGERDDDGSLFERVGLPDSLTHF